MPECKKVVVIEETAAGSGIKQALAWELRMLSPDCRIFGIDLGADFVPHGDQKKLYAYCGIDADSISRFVSGVLSDEK